jgi:hypothetical protein
VLYDTPIKSSLMPRWEGPFTIINQMDLVTHRVEDETRITIVHVKRLKLIKRDRVRESREKEREKTTREKAREETTREKEREKTTREREIKKDLNRYD